MFVKRFFKIFLIYFRKFFLDIFLNCVIIIIEIERSDIL
nr:MAG TPA: hypothetical protein [Caudoviricetes sp.]